MSKRGHSPASDYYVAKLLREKPKTTLGGLEFEIEHEGWGITTRSGRSRNGISSYYMPMDYPRLFGWQTYSQLFGHPFNKKPKPPLVIEHKGHQYLRIRRASNGQ